MFCQHCGNSVDGGNFCPHCGAPLNAPTPAPSPAQGQPFYSPQSGFCLRCGQKLQGTETECPFCGKPVPPPSQHAPSGYPNAAGYPSYPHPRYPSYPPQGQTYSEKKGTVPAVIAIIVAMTPFFGILPAIILGIIAIVRGASTRNVFAVIAGIAAIVLAIVITVVLVLVFGQMLDIPTDGIYYPI